MGLQPTPKTMKNTSLARSFQSLEHTEDAEQPESKKLSLRSLRALVSDANGREIFLQWFKVFS